MMFNRIEKSGTGIEKSGTGIEKSGTGIEKSGTGIGTGRFRHLALAAAVTAGLFSGASMADDRLMITERADGLVFTMHHAEGVLSGFAPGSRSEGGYAVIPLYSLLRFEGSAADPRVVGSGSGKEVVGSGSGKEVVGSGSGKEVVGSGSGKEVVGSGSGKEVVGSGSGSAGQACLVDGALMVVGSGSGKEVVGSGSGKEVVGSGSGKEVVGSGSGKDVVGSGSGSAGDRIGCDSVQPWGVAEVAFDDDGASIVVHRILDSGTREQVVAFLPIGAASDAGDVGDEWESDRGFVLEP